MKSEFRERFTLTEVLARALIFLLSAASFFIAARAKAAENVYNYYPTAEETKGFNVNKFDPTGGTGGYGGETLAYLYEGEIQPLPTSQAVLNANLAGLAFLAGGSDMLADESVFGQWARHRTGELYAFGVVSYRDVRQRDSRGGFAREHLRTNGGNYLDSQDPPDPVSVHFDENETYPVARNFNTESRLDIDGASFVTGLARTDVRSGALLSFGVFFEGGRGNFDIYDRAVQTDGDIVTEVNGGGDTDYRGIGAAVHADWNETDRGHIYGEASVRVGYSKTSFSGEFRLNGMPVVEDGWARDPEDHVFSAGFETGGTYYGGHLGLGLVRRLSNGSDLDFYTKLFYVRLEGDDAVMTPTGDPLSFDDAESVRWKTGLRWGIPAGGARFYIGAAYEREFDGGMSGRTFGLPIGSVDAGGGTGIGEIGFICGEDGSPFSADFNLSGYTGDREGFGGRVKLNWAL
jgi:hypothetical protein